MALGFTSHYAKSEQPFGSLILGNSENETSGSVAYSSNKDCSYSLISQSMGDSYSFSVSVDIYYSQYSSFVASSSGSTETAGSVAYSGGFSSGGESYSCSSGGASFSSGCSSGGCSTSFTC